MRMSALMVAVAGMIASSAVAQVTLTGSTIGAPVWNRPNPSGTGLDGSATATPFVAQTFTVPASGFYRIESVQSTGGAGWDGFICLYTAPFSAANGLTNLIAVNDDSPSAGRSQIETNLNAGTTYVLVTTGFGNGDAGNYVNTIAPPPPPRAGKLVAPTAVLPTSSVFVDGNGNDFRGLPALLPGAFPSVVVAGRWDIASYSDVVGGPFEMGANTLDELVLANEILSGPSPFYWTAGATNEGDIDANIGANPAVIGRSPAGKNYYQPTADWFNDFRQVFDRSTQTRFNLLGRSGALLSAEPNYAWSVMYEAGVVVTQAAENGTNYGQTVGGTPTGELFGIGGSDFGGRGGKGYSMTTGRINGISGGETGAGGAMYLGMNVIGDREEFAHDIATVWFPYMQGWMAGLLDEGNVTQWEAQDGEFQARSPWLPADASQVITPLSGAATHFRLDLPGARTPANGMVFLASADDNNTQPVFNVLEGTGANAGTWTVLGHSDNDFSDGTSSANWPDFGNTQPAFVYVSFRTPNLVGANVSSTGAVQASSDDFVGTTVTRLGTGVYAINIAGDNGEQGAMIVQGRAALAADATLPGKVFFTYDYDAASGRYIVEARQLFKTFQLPGVPADNEVDQEVYQLTDAPFSFAYIPFSTGLVNCLTDVNGDGSNNIFDIFEYFAFFGAGNGDLNEDRQTNIFDIFRFFDLFGTCQL